MKTKTEVLRDAEEHLKFVKGTIFTAEELADPLPAAIGYDLAVSALDMYIRVAADLEKQ